MRPSNIRSIHYHDLLALKRRRIFIFKVVLCVVTAIAMVAGLAYLVLFSKIFSIREISLNGFSTVNKDIVAQMADSQRGRWNNTFFFNSSKLRGDLLNAFPEIKTLTISKDYPHGIEVNIVERASLGIWCFSQDDCYSFDADGVLWKNSVQSSGFLVLSVNDQRPTGQHLGVDKNLVAIISSVSKNLNDLGLPVSSVIIPVAGYQELRVRISKGYDILVGLDSDLSAQMDVLKTFLADKLKDPAFKPQYIDLRVEGRVYYK